MNEQKPRRRRTRDKETVAALSAESLLAQAATPDGDPADRRSGVDVDDMDEGPVGDDERESEPAQPAAPPESRGESLFRRARALEETGELKAADVAYRELLNEEPDNVRARVALGMLLDRQGHHGPALDQFEAARSVAADHVDVLLHIGDSLVGMRRYEQAEKEYRRAQKLDPARSDVYIHLGILHFRRGLYSQAEIELKKGTELEPENGPAWFYRGESLNQLSRVDEALDTLLRAVQLQPNNSRAFYLMGILYDKKRMPELAMSMYRRSRELANG